MKTNPKFVSIRVNSWLVSEEANDEGK